MGARAPLIRTPSVTCVFIYFGEEGGASVGLGGWRRSGTNQQAVQVGGHALGEKAWKPVNKRRFPPCLSEKTHLAKTQGLHTSSSIKRGLEVDTSIIADMY